MKALDLFNLGRKHIQVHKRQSVLVILAASLLFGSLLGFDFLYEGLENVFVHASTEIGGKSIYVTATSCNNRGNCLSYNSLKNRVEEKIADYGGKVVGKVSVYEYKNGTPSFSVIDEHFVKNLVEVDLGEYDPGTLFKLISLDEADYLVNGEPVEEELPTSHSKIYSLSEIEELKSKTIGHTFTETFSVPTSEIGVSSASDSSAADSSHDATQEISYTEKSLDYVVVGVIGTNRTVIELSQKFDQVKLLDLFLTHVDNHVAPTGYYVSLSDGSTDYDAIFETKRSLPGYQSVEEEPAEETSAETELDDADAQTTEAPDVAEPASSDSAEDTYIVDYSIPIIEFTNSKRAYDFYKNENCALDRNIGKCTSFTVQELVGNRLQTQDALDTLYILLRYIGAILLLIAVTISVFTFMRLITENAHSIALYRSLGASTLDILFIYLFYLLELCFFTMIFATAIGVVFAGIITVVDAEALSRLLTSVYSRHVSVGLLVGFSRDIARVFLAILGVAPICSILTSDQLSTKNIAKKIKED